MTRKSKTVALLLSIFLGYLGIDRFYLGYFWTGLLKLLTGGGFFLWYVVDIVNIARGKAVDSRGGELI